CGMLNHQALARTRAPEDQGINVLDMHETVRIPTEPHTGHGRASPVKGKVPLRRVVPPLRRSGHPDRDRRLLRTPGRIIAGAVLVGTIIDAPCASLMLRLRGPPFQEDGIPTLDLVGRRNGAPRGGEKATIAGGACPRGILPRGPGRGATVRVLPGAGIDVVCRGTDRREPPQERQETHRPEASTTQPSALARVPSVGGLEVTPALAMPAPARMDKGRESGSQSCFHGDLLCLKGLRQLQRSRARPRLPEHLWPGRGAASGAQHVYCRWNYRWRESAWRLLLTYSRTLKVRGGIIAQANRLLCGFYPSSRIFPPHMIPVLLHGLDRVAQLQWRCWSPRHPHRPRT